MSLFAKAAVVETVKSGKAKSEKKQIPISNLQAYAEVDAMIKALEGLQASLGAQIKEAGFGAFMNMAHGSKPESFTGVDGIATASIEMRKRGTNSALTVDEQVMLQAAGIIPHKEVLCKELFAINPVYAGDNDLLGKVSAAIESFVPVDFIVQQAEKSKYVVSEDNVAAVFAMPKLDSKLVSAVTTMAIKAKLVTVNFAEISSNVAALIDGAKTEIEEV